MHPSSHSVECQVEKQVDVPRLHGPAPRANKETLFRGSDHWGVPLPIGFYWALESVNMQGLMQSHTIFSLMFIKRLWKKCIGQPQCREHGQCGATCKCSWVSTAIVKLQKGEQDLTHGVVEKPLWYLPSYLIASSSCLHQHATFCTMVLFYNIQLS